MTTLLHVCRLKEDRLRFTFDLEVQLLLKQGQVEVDQGNFIPNYRQSLLLHRSVVEDLNGTIQVRLHCTLWQWRCGGGS